VEVNMQVHSLCQREVEVLSRRRNLRCYIIVVQERNRNRRVELKRVHYMDLVIGRVRLLLLVR